MDVAESKEKKVTEVNEGPANKEEDGQYNSQIKRKETACITQEAKAFRSKGHEMERLEDFQDYEHWADDCTLALDKQKCC